VKKSLASEEVLSEQGVSNARGLRYFQSDHLRKDLRGRSLRGGIITLGGQGVKFLLGLVSTATLARLLRPQDFGLLAMVTAIIAFIHLFKDLGLSNATVQRSQVTHAQVSLLFWVNLALSIVVTFVVVALAPVIAWFYHEPRLVGITLTLSLNFIFSGFVVKHLALLRRQMEFRKLAMRDVGAMAFGIAAGITLAWFGLGYWALVAVPVVTNVVGCFLIWLMCDWRPSRPQLGVGARAMVSFGGNVTAFNVLNYLTLNFDNVLIGRVLGSGPLGFYTKSYGLLSLPISQINMPMASVMLPGLSRLQHDAREYARLFVDAVRAIALVTVPIVVFSFFLSQDIVLVLLGPKWLAVAPVFRCMAPAAVCGAISFAPGWLCESLGQSRRQLHYAVVSTPVIIAGFLVGIRWGIAGVAISYSITFSVCFWAYVWYSTKDSPVGFADMGVSFAAAFFPALLAGVIVWVVRWSVASDVRPVVAVMVLGSGFVLLYASGAMLTKRSRALILSGLYLARKAVRGPAKADVG